MEHIYFYQEHCYWCNQINPIIDQLIEQKYEIHKLDLDDPENSKLYDTLKKKWSIECGTPMMINTKSGITLCGNAPKETIVKWANNELEPPKTNTLTDRLNRIESKLDLILSYLQIQKI